MAISPVRERREIAQNEVDRNGPSGKPSNTAAIQQPRVVTDADVRRSFTRLDKAFDANVAAYARNAKQPTADNGILYIGFNTESEKAELDALRRTGTVRALVETSGDNDVVIGGTRYNLSAPGQVEAFVQTLKLDPRTALAVEAALKAAGTGSREKLAQIAVVFAEAEYGKPISSRLVISGHSGGLDIFGGKGSLHIADLQRLARAMPHAAACIQDIHLSACSTGGQAGLDDTRRAWQTAFPNLKTMWAYAGSSPMAPARHLEAWVRATNGPHDTIDVPKVLSEQRVAVWSRKDGYRDHIPIAQLRAAQAKADTRFAEFISGNRTAAYSGEGADPQGALADYQTYRVLSQKNELPESERAALAKKADQLLRIRYYDHGVRSEFSKRHGASIRDGFQALGLPIPDFASISRKDSLEKIASFEQKLANTHPAPAAAALAPTLRGLRDLDRNIIRDSDCHH